MSVHSVAVGAPVPGLVTFRLGDQDYATPLAGVREVVRLQGLAALPGMAPPLAGVLELRGSALPVLDLRTGGGQRGDVLVLAAGAGGPGSVGVAVDRVRAIVAPGDLGPAGDVPGPGEPGVLPAYVREVLRGPEGLVFLVDLATMVDLESVAAGLAVVGLDPAVGGSAAVEGAAAAAGT